MNYITRRLARLLHDEGGFLQFLPMIATLAGSLLGKGAQGAAAGRQTETGNLQAQDMLRNQQYNTQQNAQFNAANTDLQRKTFEENSRGGRAKQALIGNLLNGASDVSLNVPGVEGGAMGGLRMSALGEGGRGVGAELAKQAMLKLMSGDTFHGGDVLAPPQLSALPKASGWEKAMGIGGMLGSLVGGVGSILQDNEQGPQLTSTVGANPNPELLKRARF